MFFFFLIVSESSFWHRVKAFDFTKKSFLIELASVNVTEDDVNLIVRMSIYQDS
jgi:hypothetical protein